MLTNILKHFFHASSTKKVSHSQHALSLMNEKRFSEARAYLLKLNASSNIEPVNVAILGEVEYHLGASEKAELLFLKAIKAQPGLAEGHYGLSLVYYDQQRYHDALAQALYARNRDPANARILAQLGLCHMHFLEYGSAREPLHQALLLDPNNVPALNNYAITLLALGEIEEAHFYFNQALSINPHYTKAKENLNKLSDQAEFNIQFNVDTGSFDTDFSSATQLNQAGSANSNDRTAEELESDFSSNPYDQITAILLIKKYLRTLRLIDAADVLNIALAHHPESEDLILVAGYLADNLGQRNRAKKHYEHVLTINPDNISALVGLGNTLKNLGLPNDALSPLQRAVDLDENTETLLSLTFAQCTACEYEKCLVNCDKLSALSPHIESFLLNTRAICHAYLGDFDKALHFVEQTGNLPIKSTGFDVFKGMLDLMHENYRDGWLGYHHRFMLNTTMKRLLPFQQWQGEPITGKKILVLAEQGLGDQVMFASCIPDLMSLHPSEILLETNYRVAPTFKRSFPELEVIASEQRGFEWLKENWTPDYYVPLADLPRFFRNSIADFPHHHGYLRADPNRVNHWKTTLARTSNKPKIGLSWRGGMQITRQAIRSVTLDQLDIILSNTMATFVNLQYGEVSHEIDQFLQKTGISIINEHNAIQDLDEFAALISSLDLVITVCNTTVHYAGALGRPAWVLAPYVPEWRYGLSSQTMRWYPSVQIFRQPQPNNWGHVIADVHNALAEWLLKRPRQA